MYVNTRDAYSFSKLEEEFGVPTPSRDMVELFGPYGDNDYRCFWTHDPDTHLWSRHGIVRRRPEFEGSRTDERSSFLDACEELAALPAPPLPVDRLTIHREKLFLYMGFTFRWLFIPELQRWEILPLGRPNATTQQC